MNTTITSSRFNGIQLEQELEPMKTGTAKGWGMTYYWVQIAVTENNKYRDTTPEAIEWCTEQFGRSGARWFEKQKKFFFKSEKDRTVFILRWS